MQQQQSNIISAQMKSLIKQFNGKDGDNFRKDFVITQLQLSLAEQLKALRGNKTQEEFSTQLGKPQSVICRLENPDTPKSIKSLLDIAHKLGIALLVRLVDYPTLLSVTGDYSNEAMAPRAYDKIFNGTNHVSNKQIAKKAAPEPFYNVSANVG